MISKRLSARFTSLLGTPPARAVYGRSILPQPVCSPNDLGLRTRSALLLPRDQLKTAYWDLETWDLSPQFGPILAASVYDAITKKMTTYRIDNYVRSKQAVDMTDDRQLCIDLRNCLEKYHMTVGWFSKGFDLTHLRSRLVMHKERPLQEHLHLDCIWYFKGWRGLKPMSSKMKHVADFFGIEKKPDVSPEVWMKAKGGNRKAMDEVCNRCEADVRITHILTEKALELGLVKNISRY